MFKAWSIPGRLTSNGTSLVDIGANGKDDGKKELQFLPGHGLQIHTIIMRLDRETLALYSISKIIEDVWEYYIYSLKWPNPSTLGDLDGLDTSTSDGEVLVGRSNCVNHICGVG